MKIIVIVNIEYLENLKNDIMYRYGISIPICPLLVEINQRKMRSYILHIS